MKGFDILKLVEKMGKFEMAADKLTTEIEKEKTDKFVIAANKLATEIENEKIQKFE